MFKVWPYWIERPRKFLATCGCLVLAFFLLHAALKAEQLVPSPAVETTVFVALLLACWGILLQRGSVEGVMILGSGRLAEKLYRTLLNGGNQNLMAPSSGATEIAADPGATLHYSELREVALRCGVSRIVVAEPKAQSRERMAEALIACKLRGMVIEDAVDVYEQLSGKIWLEGLHADWLIYSDGFRPSRTYLFLKRCIDVAGSLALMILGAPLYALIAAAIRLDSRGPALHRQERVGQLGRSFILYKFRSMRQDAEKGVGPRWAGHGDPRTTRVGRILRRLRLDELPQLYNVLRGEMSLVGPRPERPCFVESLRKQVPYYDLRHYMKPGLTGWAQVMFSYGASVEDSYEKLQFDLYYGKHMSLWCDLKVFLKTVKVVLLCQGR